MPRSPFGPACVQSARLAAAVTLALAAAAACATQVTTNLNDRAQTIDGFGTAMAWFMDSVNQNPRSIYNTAAFRDLYFDDLGASMARIELQYTVLSDTGGINPVNSQMETPIFLGSNTYNNIARFNFDAAGVGHNKQLLQQAPQASADGFKLIGSLWSPPHWMKGPEIDWRTGAVVNAGKPTWGVTANSAGGSLIDTPQNLQQFGRYVTAWLKGWEQAAGVPLYAISIQNELAFSEFYNSAVYNPALYVKALKAVDDAINAHNTANPSDPILTKIHGPEDVGVGPTGDLGINWRQFQYINAVRADPQANASLDIWSTHGVDSNSINFENPSANGAVNWNFWNAGRSTTDPSTTWAQWQGVGPDSGDTRPTWQTERSGEVDAWLSGSRTNQNGALALGVRMHDALVTGDASAYLYWQTQFTDDRDFGLDATFTLTNDEETDRPKYAAFKHFSKHIRPGAERIEVQTDGPQLLASAYLHEDDGTLTYVLLNLDDAADAVSLTLPSGFDVSAISAWLSQNGSYDQSVTPTVVGGVLNAFMPRESMMTIVLSSLASALAGDFNASGSVEQGDLDLVLNNWGQTGTPAGWVNATPVGPVDQAELDAVLNNWGSASAPSLGSLAGLANVPEPALTMLAAAALVLGTRRIRRSGAAVQ